MNTHSIGIDFGTSKTLVSHINPQTGHPETIRLGRGGDLIPTTVYIDSSGRFSFGDDADDMIEDISGTYLRGFKMQLGSDTPVHMYLAPNGDFRQLTAKDLVREYLLYIRQEVEKLVYQGEPVTRATITRPVNFSPAQCQELQQAALAAGFEHVEFTTEPEAAGLAYCRLNAAHAFARNALVVDWGGGTLDFALVTRSHDSVRTHGHLTDGDMEMGGEKFDEILWNYAVESLKSHGVTTLNPVSQLPRVRRSKELLSSRQEVILRLSHENGACPPLELSRETFNSMIAAYIDKAAQKLHGLLSRIPAEHQPEMLLLVGGSSQIPLIKETLEEACGLPAYMWHYSREAVALGAALWNHVEQKPAAPKTESKADRIKLIRSGNNKIAVIKTLRDIYPQLRLADAKQLVESAPVILPDKTEMNPCVAAGMLERAGCKVKILSKAEEDEGEQKDTQFDNESGTNEGSPTNSTVNQDPAIILQKADNLYFGGQWAASIELYQRAAKLGHAHAQYKLAQRYLGGNGVKKNVEQAKYWAKQAAQQGHRGGIEMMIDFGMTPPRIKSTGQFSAQPPTVNQDPAIILQKADDLYFGGQRAASIELYQRAAKLGHAHAQYKLAQRYLGGNGVKKNVEQAKYWAKQAAQQGHRGGIEMMIDFGMTPPPHKEPTDFSISQTPWFMKYFS